MEYYESGPSCTCTKHFRNAWNFSKQAGAFRCTSQPVTSKGEYEEVSKSKQAIIADNGREWMQRCRIGSLRPYIEEIISPVAWRPVITGKKRIARV